MKRKLLILFLTCVVGWLSPLNAQTTTVTVGEKNGSNTTIPTLIYDGISASLSQQIYTSTELQEAGLSSGSVIKSIAFMPNTVNASSVQWSVYMVNTEKDNFTSNTDYVSIESSEVFSGSLTLTSNQWVTMELENPFTYNGNNLLICVVDNNGANAPYNPNSYYYYNTSEISIVCAGTSSLNASTNPTEGLPSIFLGSYAKTVQSRNIIQLTIAGASEPQTLSVTVSAAKEDIYSDETTTLEAEATGGTGNYNYSWSPTTGLDNPNSATPTFTPASTGDYTFTCTVTDGESEEEGSVTVNVTERPVNPYAGKQYRVKDVSTSQQYLNIYQITAGNIGGKSGVNVATSAESDWQIFTIEDTGNGTYYFRSADGYYIDCLLGWMVSAHGTTTSEATALGMVDTGAGNGTFYIQNPDGYFKVENVGGTYYPFSNGNTSDRATWVLEEYVKPPLEITSAYASASEVYTGETVTLTASATGGSGSYTYNWTCTEGSPAATDFYNTDQAVATFKPTSAGTYKFTCTVTDGQTSDTSDEIEVVVLDSSTKCTIVFEMTDSYGDGWNGSYLQVSYGDKVVNVEYNDPDPYTNTSNQKITETLNVPTGSQITVSFISVNYPSECSYVIKYEDETIIYSVSQGNAPNSTITFEACGDIPLMLTLSADNDAKGCEGSDIQLTATATGGTENYSYTWEIVSGGGSLDDATAANPTFTLEAVGSGTASNEVTLRCTVSDGKTTSSDEITLTVCKKPAFELSTQSVVVNYGETATIEVVYEPEPSYMNITCPSPEGVNYTYKTKNSADPDTIVLSYVPTVDADLVFEAENYYSYSSTIGGNLCKETKTVEVRVVNENKEAEIGTNENLLSRYYLPVKADHNYSITQQIYTAEELDIKESSQINSISFYATWCNTNARNIEVYLAETALSSFSSSTAFVNMSTTPNFSGSVTFVNEGWTTISFTKPFTYEPGTNILVCVNDKTGGTAGTFEFGHYSTADDVRSIANYGNTQYDATNFSASYNPDFDLKQNNHIKLGYVAEAQAELVATINVDATEICDGDNANRFEMFATRVENATYDWYLVEEGKADQLLAEDVREYTYSNANPGTYTIKLVVTQNDVRKESEIDLTINPTPNTDVVLGTNGYGFVDETLTYTVNNHIDGTKYAIVLVVDDVPHPANSNPEDETDIGYHVFDFDEYGTFYYTVDADREGCTAEATHSVVIYPKATFDVSNLCAGQEVEFTNKTDTPNGGWNFGEGEGFVWNFNGEEVVSNNATVTHTFAEAGTYTVTLTVTKSGVTNVATQSVVINASPVVDLSWDKTTIYEDITFTATPGAASYIWEIDDVVQVDKNEATFTYQFQSLDDYEVAVTAVSATGCSTRLEKTITITEKLSEPKVMVNNVEVSSIDMGYRPISAWMRPIDIVITPDGTTNLQINSITIEDNFVYLDEDENVVEMELNYAMLTSPVNNVTLTPGGDPLSLKLTHDLDNETFYEGFLSGGTDDTFPQESAKMIINYGVGQEKEINISYIVYEPYEGDVYDKPYVVNSSQYSVTATDMLNNYLLEGATSKHSDAVFKMTIEEGKAADIDVTVTGTNPLVYVYPDDFGGEGGPGLTNYVGYGEQSTGIFFGFEFNFEDATGLSLIDKDGNLNNFVVDIYDYDYPEYLRSSRTSGFGGTEDNYCWTLDKYYVSEDAKLSYKINAVTAGQYYEILLSENEDYSDAVVLKSATQEVNANFETVTLDLSEYAGKKYYFGIRHYSDVNGMIKFDNYRLYEDTRATREGTTFNFMLGEGTYYIVAAAQFENISSSNSFNVTITSENLEAPDKAVAVLPQDKALGIATTIGQLKWNFGANTEKYQVLFGTTNPPTETMIEWNNYLEANPSCPLRPLATNTVYYWRVDAQNPAGTTEGDVWRFATDFDAPQNLVLSKEVIDLGQTSELSWTGVDFGDVEGYYNILVDGEKWGESVTKTTTTFVLSGLPYKNEPYEITVEAVYPIDSWDVTAESESVALKVNTYSMGVKGYVYDDYTKEPIQGAKVTYGTASATTNESGYYSIITALAGSYIAGASCTGYIRNEVLVNVPTDKEFEQDFYLISAKTMPEVVATERNENVVDVEWTLNSISEPMYEDFENEAFKYNWKTSANYPWEVVANGFTDGDEYDFFGGYCVKSTNSDYDIDPINTETGKKYDDGVYEFGGTTSFLELKVYVPYSTTMRFYYRISSTEGYLSDYGRFLVNGVQVGDNYLGNGSWSKTGFTDYGVIGGQTYTFRWEYVKDGGNYYFEDAFFIDNISFYENANLYNVYVKDILSDDKPTKLATEITAEEYEYTDWETETDGIYQWGVSAIYNEQGNTLSEDFSDGTMSMGWTKTDLSTGWNNWLILNQQVDGYFQAYDGYSIICSGLDSDDKFYLVTPEIDASIQSTLEFVYIAPQYENSEGVHPEFFNKFRVVYGDTPTGPWTPLTDYNTASVEAWTSMEVSLPLQKTLYIAFEHYDHETGFGLGLDNVVVRREAVTGESNIAWSNLIGKGNKLVTNNGDWSSATSWSRLHIPTVDEVAIIKAAGTVNGAGAVAKAVLVDNGTLTIGESGVLTAPTVIDSVAADITINAGGQLVHSNEGVMATFVKGIQAYTDAAKNDGWYTISSPLAANINASDVTNLLSDDFDLYRYDEPTHYWENYEDAGDAEGPNNTDWDNNSAVIEKGRGYLYANGADKQLSFAGELNVAEVTTTLSAQASSLKGFNLLGNPFAHNIYKGVAFSGSIAEAHYTLNYHGEWQVVTSENPIKSGAGFLVQATEGANLTISKTNAQTRAAANSMLAVTVVNNVFEDVAYVSFNDGIGLEKIGHMNEYAPMVYIPGDFNNYAYATVEEDVTEVPVNFEAMTMGEYTIAVKAKNCEYETMILVDNLTGKETNLLKDSYTFMATTTDDPDRFVIKLAKDAEVEDSFIYINNGELIFDNLSSDAIINVFDVLGRNVATFNNCGDTTFRVSTDLFADGVYMVRVIEGNNVKVQKMVIE